MEPKVIIIGAGCAGLEAADQLYRAGIKSIVLEANDYIGGRVLSQNGWADDIPIELGAEFIHGENSLHYKYALETGAKMGEAILDGTMRSWHGAMAYPGSKLDKDIMGAINAVSQQQEPKALRPDGTEMSIEEFMKNPKFNEVQRCILKNYAHSLCGSNPEHVGVESWRKADTVFEKTYGEEMYWRCLDMSNSDFLKKKYNRLFSEVKLNTFVKKVDYSKEEVIVTDSKGNTYKGTAVIVTVPVPILQANEIQFVPELPKEKKEAIQKIRMEPMAKIFLAFKERFWDDRMLFHFFDGFIGVAWAPGVGGKGEKNNVLCFHAAGNFSREAAKMSEEMLKEKLLDELSIYFGDAPRKLFLRMKYFEWANQPNVRGGYSSPTLGEGDSRKAFEVPEKNRLLFAGEAYQQLGMSSTIASALQSGNKVAAHLISLYSKPKPKL